MSTALWFGTTLALSFLLAMYLTPTVRRGAVKFGVLDHPIGALKTQKEPVPYLGGIAIYLAFLLTMSLVFTFDKALLGFLLGGTLMTMLGLFDDLRVLPPALKLIGQFLAAWVMLRCGIYIKLTMIPEPLALVLSVLWLVGITNAVNIIDVSDGLAGSVGVAASLAMFVVAYIDGNDFIATCTLALAGSIAGFLPTNWCPARIYLGDAGSLFVGFMLASLSMVGSYTQHSVVGALAPLGILVVPILDITLVSFARLRQGKSPLQGSPDHFAIRLKRHGWSAQGVAHFAWALTAFGSAVGLSLMGLPFAQGATVAAAAAVTFVALLIWLGTKSPHVQSRAAEAPQVATSAPH